ncbi:hypothetical protein [Streptomyces sp. SID8352]|nr:hypothetical protein [Streptomyces sp. SID8352]
MTETPEVAPEEPPPARRLPYGWWEESPAQAARYDRDWFDRDED